MGVNRNHNLEVGKGKRNPKAVIFDLDGTLADTTDPNGHHKVDHDSFRSMANEADTREDIVEKLHKEKEKGRDIVILSARSSHYRSDTKRWLDNKNIPYDALIMRPIGDDRKDKVVKESLLKEEVLPNFKVKKAYDDKKKNVKMFKNAGIDAKRV